MSSTREKQTNYFVHTLLRARDWQHRPQYDQVCNWWCDGGRGVCALVGMGGAGKTAIAERFLNELPVGRIANPSSSASRSVGEPRIDPPLPQPHGVFVYSFYDDDKPENLYRHLQMWLEGSSKLEHELSPTQLTFEIQQHQGLIILDGLEKVQESGARGGFGRLTSSSLRELLNHIASGSACELSVLVTSRFPLADLRDSQPRFFHRIAVDQLDVVAGIALLRSRGVCGTDAQLVPIVEHCGRHALTINLAGGYIKEYGHGDPSTPLNLGMAEELQAEVEDEPDDDKRAVLIQSRRFFRIAQRYREAMLDSDEAALALLERICLFRLGIDSKSLAAIFTGADAEKVSGKALASLNADQLQKKLAWLARMRIVERSKSSAVTTEDSKPKTLYTIHPAVRDEFVSRIGRKEREASHEAVRKGLEASLRVGPRTRLGPGGFPVGRLSGQPGERHPSAPATLDLLEEIIHHTIQSGKVRSAWDIYRDRIGGYQTLGWRLGAYSRGKRICELFGVAESLKQSPGDALRDLDLAFLNYHYALYQIGLGEHAAVHHFLGVAHKLYSSAKRLTGASRSCRIAAELFTHLGRLRSAKSSGEDALAYGVADKNERSQRDANVLLGYVKTMTGELRSAHVNFEDAHAIERQDSNSQEFAIWSRAVFLLSCGRFDAATVETRDVIWNSTAQFGERNLHIPRCQIVLAELARLRGDNAAARDAIMDAREWALARDAKQLLCWAAVVQTRIERSALSNELCKEERVKHVTANEAAITQGLTIARDCGYGLYHIDLLLERARLHLLRGDAGAALDDIEVALDTGIPGNEETGQVELFAANHEECGYAWAIPAGLQLRAEALLLQAAQTVRSRYLPSVLVAALDGCLRELDDVLDEFRGATRAKHSGEYSNDTLQTMVAGRPERGLEALRQVTDAFGAELPRECGPLLVEIAGFLRQRIDRTNVDKLVSPFSELVEQFQSALTGHRAEYRNEESISDLIDQAKQLLHEALDHWHDLRDPEPTEDNNFKHPKTGKEYNYRAAETHQVLVQLEGGTLTRFPLKSIDKMSETPEPTDQLIRRLLSSDVCTELTDRETAAVTAWLRANPTGFTTIWAEKHASGGESESLRQMSHLRAMLDFNQQGQRKSKQSTTEEVMSKRFNVALSFPGEHRGFVLEVAKALADKLTPERVFYDEWYEVELLGTNGDLKLQSMYEDADLVVPFFSEHYDKPWCSLEWETIRGILLNRRKDDAVIPVHLDDTDVPGWAAVNFGIRLRGRNPKQIADLILQALFMRISKPGKPPSPPQVSPSTAISPTSDATSSRAPAASGAMAIWQEKLDYLRQQEAITADPAQRFALRKQIEEAEKNILDLRKNP